MDSQAAAIGKVRSFNRFYTRVLGLLDGHILQSDFSLTEARVLLEIGRENRVTARGLEKKLSVDPSYMSRILKRFEAKKLITKTPCARDGRRNDIRLTDAGRALLGELEQRSETQVAALLDGLSPEEIKTVLDAMTLIRDKFSHALLPVTIRNYREGDADYIIRRHRELYLKEYGLSASFGPYVDQTVHKLTDTFDPEKECVLIPELDGRPMGSVAVGRYDDQTAQLRYFLLEPEARGCGLGLYLIESALAFCRRAGYRRVFLETISLLTTARSIYARMGFHIAQTHVQSDWGREVEEERWELEL